MRKFYLIQTKTGSNDWTEKARYNYSKQALEAYYDLILCLKTPPDDDDDYASFIQHMVPFSKQDEIEVRLLSVVGEDDGFVPYEIMDYQVC